MDFPGIRITSKESVFFSLDKVLVSGREIRAHIQTADPLKNYVLLKIGDFLIEAKLDGVKLKQGDSIFFRVEKQSELIKLIPLSLKTQADAQINGMDRLFLNWMMHLYSKEKNEELYTSKNKSQKKDELLKLLKSKLPERLKNYVSILENFITETPQFEYLLEFFIETNDQSSDDSDNSENQIFPGIFKNGEETVFIGIFQLYYFGKISLGIKGNQELTEVDLFLICEKNSIKEEIKRNTDKMSHLLYKEGIKIRRTHIFAVSEHPVNEFQA